MPFKEDAMRAALKADYEAIRAQHPQYPLKPYDDLTDEERAKHRDSYHKLHRFYDDLGQHIREGGPAPNPLDYWKDDKK